jgi:hypothetical protein
MAKLFAIVVTIVAPAAHTFFEIKLLLCEQSYFIVQNAFLFLH